jgi:hypothetical protein
VNCDSKFLRDPKEEQAADTIAARKIGFGPVKAFLLREEEVTGAKYGEAAERLRELEKLAAQEHGQR